MRQATVTLLIAVLMAAAGHAQSGATSTSPQASFKTGVNLVEIHAVVTDGRGEFVRGLTKDDFEIYESGRLQTPTVFDLVDAPMAMRASSAAPIDPDVRATKARFDGRLFIIVLDDLHTATLRSQLVRRAARQFVERHVADGDLAAVVHTSGRTDAAQELTPSRRLLLAAVDKFQGQKLPSITGERLAVHLNDRDLQRASMGEGDGSSGAPSRQTQRADDPRDAERGMNARRALSTIKNVAEWMADVPGRRKALVLFSEGIEYDIYDVFNNRNATSVMADARDAIAAAQRSNVTVYAVDPRGLTQLGDEAIAIQSLSDDPHVDYGTTRGFQTELLMAQESLISLAEETGGIAIVKNNDIAGGLARVERDTSRYYVLGYVSDPAVAPGKFRKIEVKVKQPGLKVRARRGYVPADLMQAKRTTDVKPGTSPALTAALTNPVPVGDVGFRVWAAPFKGSGKNASVAIAVEIDGPTLRYRQQDGRFLEDLELSIVAADYNGKVRGSDRQTMNLKLKPETHQAMMAGGGVRMLSRIEVPPGRYQLRVGVHESSGGNIGSVPLDLEVPDFSKAALAMSGLAVTSSRAPRLVTAKPDPALKDVLPLPPVASRAFTAVETLNVFAEIYDRTSPTPHDLDIVVTVRPKDGDAHVYQLTERRRVDAGGGVRTAPYKADIPLNQFKAGDYVLKVEVRSPAGEHATVREIPFTVLGVSPLLTY
ncbi:MAG TPA: VWA domain-containing protein [Vicinamibacterales bacterium]